MKMGGANRLLIVRELAEEVKISCKRTITQELNEVLINPKASG